MKETLKKLLKLSPIPLTKNHKYDLLTNKILSRVLKEGSNTVDVGCHKGEILEKMLKLAPKGHHFGFEPIPDLFIPLALKFADKPNCTIIELALSDQEGSSSFNYVTSNPSYSGIKKRRYDRENEVDTVITVQCQRLDNILTPATKIDLIKIDVEGAEWLVLQGASEIIARDQPFVIFEHGLGASDFYGASPADVLPFFESKNMRVSTLDAFLNGKVSLDLVHFENLYRESKEYYFIAHK